MRTETRELYCYVTGTEPFRSHITKVKDDIKKLRGLVADAAGTYHNDYCTLGTECFNKGDIEIVTSELYLKGVME